MAWELWRCRHRMNFDFGAEFCSWLCTPGQPHKHLAWVRTAERAELLLQGGRVQTWQSHAQLYVADLLSPAELHQIEQSVAQNSVLMQPWILSTPLWPQVTTLSLDQSSLLLLSQMSVILDVTVTWIMRLVDSLVLKLEKRSLFPSELCMYLLFDHIGRALSCLQRSFSSAFSGNKDLVRDEY